MSDNRLEIRRARWFVWLDPLQNGAKTRSASPVAHTSGSRTSGSHCLGAFDVEELHRSIGDSEHRGFDDEGSADVDDAEDQL